jgi:hypothetical protein
VAGRARARPRSWPENLLKAGREEGEEGEGEEEGAVTWVASAAPLAAPALLKGLACRLLRVRKFFAFVFAFAFGFAFVVLIILGQCGA